MYVYFITLRNWLFAQTTMKKWGLTSSRPSLARIWKIRQLGPGCSFVWILRMVPVYIPAKHSCLLINCLKRQEFFFLLTKGFLWYTKEIDTVVLIPILNSQYCKTGEKKWRQSEKHAHDSYINLRNNRKTTSPKSALIKTRLRSHYHYVSLFLSPPFII